MEESLKPDVPDRQRSAEDHFPVLADILNTFPCEPADIRTYSPLALAFLGDGVYSLIIRSVVTLPGNRQAQKLHDRTAELVSAHAQALVSDAVQGLLTEEERRICKRGQNANPSHHAKNATITDYLKATGLETLCGWLYLQNRLPRFLELLKEGMQKSGLWMEENTPAGMESHTR